MKATFNALDVTGMQQDDFLPTIIALVDTEKKTENVIADIVFETNPLDGTCDHRLHVETNPLKIIYDSETINKCVEVFRTDSNSALEQ